LARALQLPASDVAEEPMDTMEALKQIVIFKGVPDPILRIVAEAGEEVTIGAGESIVGDSGLPKALYAIRHGTVRLVVRDEGAPAVLFGPGETIGEVEFIDGGPGPAGVTALERVDVLVLRSDRLATALAGHPEAAYELYRAVARSLAGRLRRAVAMVALGRHESDRSISSGASDASRGTEHTRAG
jgi:CRP-like cAMP-binding protein